MGAGRISVEPLDRDTSREFSVAVEIAMTNGRLLERRLASEGEGSFCSHPTVRAVQCAMDRLRRSVDRQ